MTSCENVSLPLWARVALLNGRYHLKLHNLGYGTGRQFHKRCNLANQRVHERLLFFDRTLLRQTRMPQPAGSVVEMLNNHVSGSIALTTRATISSIVASSSVSINRADPPRIRAAMSKLRTWLQTATPVVS